jgi:Na+/H+ antiporter NhaB
MQRVHAALAHLFAGLLVVQFFLAGLGAFDTVHDKHFKDSNFNAHSGLGDLLVLLALIIAGIALFGRWSRFVTRVSLLLFGLMVLQLILGVTGANDSAWLGALHAVNALLIVGVTVVLIRESRAAMPTRPQPE